MTVAFCGHAQISQSEKIEKWLYDVTQKLIEQGATTFYLGGYGAFDSLAASVLREQKKRYSQIELVLVLAYLNTGRDTSGYDSTVYPPLETVPRRFAISHRNRWMVESADVVVAYVLHDWGGAATTLRCAKQKKKQIISYRDEGAVAKRKWSNSPVFCGKVVLCSILGYKLLKSLSPKGKNGTAKLGFSGEERSSFLHFPVVKKSILFSGERDDFSAVPVAVWPSTFSGQRPGRAGTVPVRYWSCPA